MKKKYRIIVDEEFVLVKKEVIKLSKYFKPNKNGKVINRT